MRTDYETVITPQWIGAQKRQQSAFEAAQARFNHKPIPAMGEREYRRLAKYARYNASEKGKLRRVRYELTEKGRIVRERYAHSERRYWLNLSSRRARKIEENRI